ncbi:hypothetical protein EAE96_004033 [Botrytis aclada]|nr:hypothetical protein EAE96_004033 [Botrytis aclada]
MYPKISLQLTTAIAILSTLTTALPAPLDTNTKAKASTCSVATVDSTCIGSYNSCMISASGDNDAITTCALNLSTCTDTTEKRDTEILEERAATACANGAQGSVACVETFGTCMKAAKSAGEITSCALALSACEVAANTK